MKKSDVLREVKKLLWDGVADPDFNLEGKYRPYHRYICLIIDFDLYPTLPAGMASAVKADVQLAMGAEGCYEDVIASKIGYSELHRLPTSVIQQKRQGFLDSMIKSYEEKGQ